MNHRYLILDIDNCIADDSWRIPHIDWTTVHLFRRYHHYHMLAPWDAPGNTELFTKREEKLLLFTSRPVHYRVSTVEWLRRNGVAFEYLLMRNDLDHRSSLAVKRSQLNWLAEYKIELTQITCAYDDRPEIIDMYRAFGLKAEVRAIHDVCAYINPNTGMNHANGQPKA